MRTRSVVGRRSGAEETKRTRGRLTEKKRAGRASGGHGRASGRLRSVGRAKKSQRRDCWKSVSKIPVSFSGFCGEKSRECGGLAQLGERLPCKQEVTGSIPVLSTKEVLEMGQ